MKINEPFGIPVDQDSEDQGVADDSRLMESEIFHQLKTEFQDFVAQTRERLRLVSESLVELDREFSLEPQVDLQEIDAFAPVEDSLADGKDLKASGSDPVERSVASQAAQPDDRNTTRSSFDFWDDFPGEADDQVTLVEDASPDASFHHPDEKSPEVFRTIRPVSSGSREAFGESPASSSNTEIDADPMERLNAIKQRLARQIENS